MTDAPVVHWDSEGKVLVIRLNRPPANALGAPLVEGLSAAVARFEEGDEKAAVVCSDLPGYFVAGADIKHMADLSDDDFAVYGSDLRAPMERLARCGKPSIAAIDGLALGGGLELAMACTLRFATPGSQLGLPEAKLGIIPGAGGTQRLPRLVGRGRALKMTLSGEPVDAVEAERIGLVDELVDGDVAEAAITFAGRLAELSAVTLEVLLECADAAEFPHEEGAAVEVRGVLRTFAEGEAREGLSAFVQKRQPVFD